MNDALSQIVARAGQRFAGDIARDLRAAGARLAAHLHRVPSLTNPAAALEPQSFPIFALPFWLTPKDAREGPSDFLPDITYSTFAGYFGIRLIDNVMDGDGPSQLTGLLPTSAYFHWRFIEPYTRHFAHGHRFWDSFNKVWSNQADCTAEDAALADISAESFYRISSRKFGAAKIPLAAVAHRYALTGSINQWWHFVDVLAEFVQFMNDFLDWRHDDEYRINTLLQSESRRRRKTGESHGDWFVREGAAWGSGWLETQIQLVQQCARNLESAEVEAWVAERSAMMRQQLSRALTAPALFGGNRGLGDSSSEH